ncbi:MAG: shikimate kinase [Firmicutes bacterium]|nr:shikimate kinase [Bacillota bacterium]
MEIVIDKGLAEHWNNIYLIGYMGVGKSSTAKHLAKILDLTVIELDQAIENHYGKPIMDIFDEIGEEGFRALETIILASSISGTVVPYDIYKGAVFSCGGGVPLNEVNVTAMFNSGRIVYLKAKPETVLARLQNDNGDSSDGDTSNGRPLLRGKMNLSDIKEMMEIRAPYYEDAADLIIETDNKTPEEVAGEIVMELNLIPNLS